MNKKKLRQFIKQQLSQMDQLTHTQYSFQIAQQLFSSLTWKKSSVIGVTVSRLPEIDTWNIIQQGWLENKKVVVPKCHPQDYSMTFYELHSFLDLEIVYYGLYEPNPTRTTSVDANEIDLMIVPGLAFDESGNRLGVGGGYYDRFLADYHGTTLALAFSFQLLKEVPIDKYDLPVQSIITENKYLSCKR